MKNVVYVFLKVKSLQSQKHCSKNPRTLLQVRRCLSKIRISFFSSRKTKHIFFAELNAFNNTVNQLSNTLSEKSAKIDKMKLQAIGQRNIYESARAERKRKRTELANLIKEKLRELDRQNAQLDSLNQVERQQQALIEKLTSTD